MPPFSFRMSYNGLIRKLIEATKMLGLTIKEIALLILQAKNSLDGVSPHDYSDQFGVQVPDDLYRVAGQVKSFNLEDIEAQVQQSVDDLSEL